MRQRGTSSMGAAVLAVACLIAPNASKAAGALAGVAPAAPSATPREGTERPLRTRNVVLVTVDGVRIQELFSGMDSVVAQDDKRSGIYDAERARKKFWRDTAEERRLVLMSYFWGHLAPQGIVLGNKEKGSSVQPRNPHLFSAPGYAEILTGQFQPDVVSNDIKRYPHPTVLEFVRRRLQLGARQVATFGSWEGFATLSSSHEGEFFTNAGYERVPDDIATQRMAFLGDLQFQVMALWEVGRSDAITFHLALEYLKTQRPRLLYIALGESDDWAHAKRYDRLLDYLEVLDSYLKILWGTIESTEGYRGRTTLILTTDHGRGVRSADWDDHDEGVKGSEDIWIAVVGPDTPDRGELAPYPTVHQADVAATILRFFRLDPAEFNPHAGPPIPAAFADPGTPP